jgi:hypothetical protein
MPSISKCNIEQKRTLGEEFLATVRRSPAPRLGDLVKLYESLCGETSVGLPAFHSPARTQKNACPHLTYIQDPFDAWLRLKAEGGAQDAELPVLWTRLSEASGANGLVDKWDIL